MAKYATGKRSQAISDRSGMAFPYTEMVKEWNGSLVHYSEFEPKHPQIRRKHATADAIALQNSRNMKFQTPTSIESLNSFATNDATIASSGGQGMATINLTLPGPFAFTTVGAPSESIEGNNITTMIPADPSVQNRKRQLESELGLVTVSIT